ncbi:histidine--tRNA ligase [Candidatus Gottesmanbacteria bacterium RIFCSPLOWO2_01_FULL_48_11]|uniref:Histidine--tRNA ligase n=2 Tax=Candidatus Gottesmaniibacteriota TaxID=1752720 RepID=A0A0G1X052_9BACT|nr:MAG: Histidyl-tRNA synthetase [Candidatus Gottesmanbacteria bacterium GW2011_GWA2_47_9]OGG28358.1 MAG: histidine--tRNA ligase [Candidatus Gottesmanbacteria bacterium RIFCSPLOWO2_01_FULL_48_11]
MIKPQTLKGFRDFLPKDAKKRQFVIGKIREVFECFGFDPLETPALEYAETLLGKYGNEADKLLYLFKDNGDRNVGLRYDQTVPLSRVVAQYQQQLPLPFKRYQIQPVWRAENTQKGRFREFLQCDIDTVGTDSPLADAETIDCTLTTFRTLGFSNTTMLLNDRTLFDTQNLTKQQIIILDKLDKIGKDEVIKQLIAAGRSDAENLMEVLAAAKPTDRLSQVIETLKNQGYKQEVDFRFAPFLARGLDYYTSTIFELTIAGYGSGSLAGGGRYDKLIGQFSGRDVPAVGIAFGFDRMIEAMEEHNLLPTEDTVTQVLVGVFSQETLAASLATASSLRSKAINTEVFLENGAKLDKQLKYADRKGIPFVIIQGPEEVAKGVVKLKDMKNQSQEELTVNQVVAKLLSS